MSKKLIFGLFIFIALYFVARNSLDLYVQAQNSRKVIPAPVPVNASPDNAHAEAHAIKPEPVKAQAASSIPGTNSHAMGLWSPTSRDTCTQAQHDAYFVVGPDGKN